MLQSASHISKKANILQPAIKGCCCINAQQTRTTIIVERVHKMGNRKGDRVPHYKNKHFIYRVAEKKSYADAQVDCIFIQDCPVGRKGDVKTVKASLFRKKLFPYNAVYACEDNLRDWDHILKKTKDTKHLTGLDFLNAIKQEPDLSAAAAAERKQKNYPQTINEVVDTLSKQHLMFEWKQDAEVTAALIRTELRRRGIYVPSNAITFVEGPMSEIGDYVVMVTVNETFNVFIRTSIVEKINPDYMKTYKPLKIMEPLYCVVKENGEIESAYQNEISAAIENFREVDLGHIINRSDSQEVEQMDNENKTASILSDNDDDKPV